MSTAMMTTDLGYRSTIRSPQRSATAARPRLRLTRRGRALLTVLISVPLVAAAMVMALNGGGATATSSPSTTSFQYVTVSAGESLWQVASEVAPTADPRDVIAEIIDLNQLSGTNVQPGQRLAIPLEYEH